MRVILMSVMSPPPTVGCPYQYQYLYHTVIHHMHTIITIPHTPHSHSTQHMHTPPPPHPQRDSNTHTHTHKLRAAAPLKVSRLRALAFQFPLFACNTHLRQWSNAPTHNRLVVVVVIVCSDVTLITLFARKRGWSIKAARLTD
ncbi:hypothetical protein BC832DRAFT_460856 [Gaertneriomyces semiglobifer]|nr:hypothetical protein BC832DRAFT_460856 [Gaertneriomyces semiglobifer]